MTSWVHQHWWPVFVAAVLALVFCVAVVVQYLRSEARQPLEDDPLDLPGPDLSMPAPGAGELHDEWEQLDPDQAADQLIAEWHAPDLELTAEDWIARDLADLELLAWDARVQAARCWEIVHVEFPRLRAELCAA